MQHGVDATVEERSDDFEIAKHARDVAVRETVNAEGILLEQEKSVVD